jgi:hypothetical protein
MAKKANDIIGPLRLFNEKTDKLGNISFFHTLLAYGGGFSIGFENLGNGNYQITQERTGPLEEAIDAFVLTFRFFIQNNETTSFYNLSKLYENAPVNDMLKKQFKIVRKNINKYLDSNSDIPITINDELLTHRKIMETMIFGGLSHANPEKKKNYDFWMATPLKTIVINDFVFALGTVYKAILAIKEINLKALKELEG